MVQEFSFSEQKTNLLSLLNETSEILLQYGFQPRIESAIERLNREKMNLLIVGEFSRGKSTFINALLHHPVLPAKVNPTTATINLIEAGKEREIRLYERNGGIQNIELPENQTNKFLNNIVTTANQSVNLIEKVRITWPGSFSEWNCTIVDTPGVNELDELREEVTYSYLSKADACVVILDHSPPLSESERRFLVNKVLLNDVNRLLFVINRMDEIEDAPNGDTSRRLIKYTKELISEFLPTINSPEIYSISSRKALQARFKQEKNEAWELSFQQFESQLLRFISAYATMERLPEHIDRLIGIICDGMNFMQDRKSILNSSSKEVDEKLQLYEIEEKHLQTQLRAIHAYLDKETAQLSLVIRDYFQESFTTFASSLMMDIKNCNSNLDLANLKSNMMSGIRQIIEEAMEIINKAKRDIWIYLTENHSDWLKTIPRLKLPLNTNQDTDFIDKIDLKVNSDRKGSEERNDLLANFAIGGTIGYLGGALFGPVGLVAGIIGSVLLGKEWGAQRNTKELETIKRQFNIQLKIQINQVLEHVRLKVNDIVNQEVSPIANFYKERLQGRMDSLRNTIDHNKSLTLEQTATIKGEKSTINQNLVALHKLLDQVQELRGEFQNESIVDLQRA